MTIKHLVFPGGGPIIFNMLGSLHFLEKNNIWKIEDIKSIYGTSSGGIMGVIVCLKHDWQTIIDYFLERPWHEVFQFNIKSLLNCYSKRGLFGKDYMTIIFKPLFESKNISLDITMKEFYEMSGIDLHLFSFELNTFKTIDLSHSTHPDISLLKALYMSCTLPILLEPIITENECYIDGGITNNYPLYYCVEKYKNKDEILGLTTSYDINNSYKINDSSNLIDLISNILFKIIYNFNIENIKYDIKHEVILKKKDVISLIKIQETIYSNKIRNDLFNSGEESSKVFLELYNSK